MLGGGGLRNGGVLLLRGCLWHWRGIKGHGGGTLLHGDPKDPQLCPRTPRPPRAPRWHRGSAMGTAPTPVAPPLVAAPQPRVPLPGGPGAVTASRSPLRVPWPGASPGATVLATGTGGRPPTAAPWGGPGCAGVLAQGSPPLCPAASRGARPSHGSPPVPAGFILGRRFGASRIFRFPSGSVGRGAGGRPPPTAPVARGETAMATSGGHQGGGGGCWGSAEGVSPRRASRVGSTRGEGTVGAGSPPPRLRHPRLSSPPGHPLPRDRVPASRALPGDSRLLPGHPLPAAPCLLRHCLGTGGGPGACPPLGEKALGEGRSPP